MVEAHFFARTKSEEHLKHRKTAEVGLLRRLAVHFFALSPYYDSIFALGQAGALPDHRRAILKHRFPVADHVMLIV